MGFNRMDSAAYLASQMAKGFARSLQQRAATLGFSPGQFPILLELWSEDGLTQKQLLERIDIEQATMANTLSRMERDGLVERRPHPSELPVNLALLKGAAVLGVFWCASSGIDRNTGNGPGCTALCGVQC